MNWIILIAAIATLVLFDFYVFQGAKIIIRKWPSFWRKAVYVSFWGATIYFIIALLLYRILGPEALNFDLHFQGEQYRTVDTRVSGDLLVWSAMIHPYRTTGSGVATRETEAVAVNAAKLRELCEKDHELGYDLLKEVAHVMSQRLQGARIQLAAV